jgi:aspergillopepsin I
MPSCGRAAIKPSTILYNGMPSRTQLVVLVIKTNTSYAPPIPFLPPPLTLSLQLDSGTTQLYLSPTIADAIAAKFDPPAVFNSVSGVYVVPCNAKAPWFAIQIGSVIFPVDKRDMIISDGAGGCYAGTNNGDIYAPYALGDVFMNNVLTVFDVGSGQMKFRSR